ncbi:MAG: hypothetical protein ACREIA_20790, partial [Opitutaceae bacterium]
EYGEVACGSIDVFAQMGETRLRANVSALSHPVREWVLACIQLHHQIKNDAEGAGDCTTEHVTWMDEPAAYQFRVSPSDDSNELTIECFWDPEPIWQSSDFRWQKAYPSIALSWDRMAREVCRATRELYRRYGLRRYVDEWIDGQFPAGYLLQLHGLVYGKRIFECFPLEHLLLAAETIPESTLPPKDFEPAGMQHADFRIGREFLTAAGHWRCTDVGARTIAAIKLDHPEDPSWYNGPPYAVVEQLFDEDDLEGCSPAPGR